MASKSSRRSSFCFSWIASTLVFCSALSSIPSNGSRPKPPKPPRPPPRSDRPPRPPRSPPRPPRSPPRRPRGFLICSIKRLARSPVSPSALEAFSSDGRAFSPIETMARSTLRTTDSSVSVIFATRVLIQALPGSSCFFLSAAVSICARARPGTIRSATRTRAILVFI
ncbi:MAG: hypothetical protein CMJ90_15055 [Planctomycetes bacterium]|nr:hypothetical protein [Planctomycetota bacterium]